MLAFSGFGDPCDPADSDYDPNDPVCAAFYGGPASTATPSTGVQPNITGSCTLDSDCPKGQTCNAVTSFCEPMATASGTAIVRPTLNPATAAHPSTAAAALPAVSWKVILFLGLLGVGGFFAYKALKKR